MNCEWSEYGEWSDCSKTCGGGEKSSTRTILQEPINGGNECEGEDTKIEPCNENSCPGILNHITK